MEGGRRIRATRWARDRGLDEVVGVGEEKLVGAHG